MAETKREPLRKDSSLEEVALAVARLLDDKRGEDIRILKVRDILQICSYFVIATGTSNRHLQTLADGASRLIKPLDLPRMGREGYRDGRWVCLDYSELVIHLFDRDARQFYDFDHLWGDAPEVPFQRADSA